MALRVLLADESSTIKKVMQLALQDYGVEVRAVPVGLDVASVCAEFQPDIVFADVLLTKRNGYEVCKELKSQGSTASIPVILIWSGFMDFNEAQAKEARADDRLEKPFDTDVLRKLVQKWVPRLSENRISEFLTFPKFPSIEEQSPSPLAPTPITPTTERRVDIGPPKPSEIEAKFEIDMPLVNPMDEVDEFQQVQIKTPAKTTTPNSNPNSHQGLDSFRLQFNVQDELPEDEFTQIDLSQAKISTTGGAGEMSLADLGAVKSQSIGLDPLHAEEVLRQEVRKVLESIAWKVIPEMAEKVIREELQKLLAEKEQIQL